MIMVSNETETEVAVIGAGPAGLTAAYLLSKKGIPSTVLEADPTYVGGLSKTVAYRGFLFDIGGHRFFSKSRVVEDLWTEILPEGLLERARSSRIYYGGQFFSYPLKAREALAKLGVIEAARCVLSYVKARARPIRPIRSFQDWVTNQFGFRLFQIFFKTYTEKVWGMDCREISADWAAQRIKGLSMASVLLNAVWPAKLARSGNRSTTIKTLIESFRYPARTRNDVGSLRRQDPGSGWKNRDGAESRRTPLRSFRTPLDHHTRRFPGRTARRCVRVM